MGYRSSGTVGSVRNHRFLGAPKPSLIVICVSSELWLVLIFFSFIDRVKEADESSGEEERELSEEEMDWSGNNSLFGHLSIPQLDGAADENSGVYQHPPKT